MFLQIANSCYSECPCVLDASMGFLLIWRSWFPVYQASHGATLIPSDCLVSCLLSQGWLVRPITAGLGTLLQMTAVPVLTLQLLRWMIDCCDSHSHSTLIPLVPFVLQRQPVLVLVALLRCSLLVAHWGMSGQVSQTCLETSVSGDEMTVVPLDGQNCAYLFLSSYYTSPWLLMS